MPARLFCKTGDLAGSSFTIERETTIGRLEENQIILHPTYISGKHARIYFDTNEDRYFLEDLNSSNGTRLDGTRITEPARLDRLHVITFAKRVDFIFHVVSEAALNQARPAARPPVEQGLGAGARDLRDDTNLGDFFNPLPDLHGPADEQDDDATELRDPFLDVPASDNQEASGEKTAFGDAFILTPPSPVPPTPDDATRSEQAFPPPPPLDPPAPPPRDDTVLRAAPYSASAPPVLAVTMPNNAELTFSLKEGVQVIGREPFCDITLPDNSISRQHARITMHGGTVTIEDLGSKNGTFIDEKRLTAATPVQSQNRIRLGLSIEARLKQA